MLRPLCVRVIASASRGATEITCTLSAAAGGTGSVSVTKSRSISDATMRSTALAAKMPCVAAT